MSFEKLLELNDLFDEIKRRKAHKFNAYIPNSDPKNNQLGFHKSTAWMRLIFGGNRSGKSKCASQEILWWATENHPYQNTPKKPRIWCIAPEYRVIYEGIWSHLRDNLPDWEISLMGPKVPSWAIPTFIEFKKGARIDFISAEGGDTDRKKIQAAEIDLLSIDEEVAGDLWDELEMRLLTRGGRIMVSATLVNSEPWLLDFEDKAISGESDVHLTRLDTTANQYNNKIALERILKRLSPEERDVRIHGRARKLKGLIFSNFGDHNRIDDFIIPPNWPRIHIFDPGFRTAAAIWIAISPTGKYFVYREMYLHFAELRDCVEFFKISEGWKVKGETWIPGTNGIERIVQRIIDPRSFSRQTDGSLGVGDQLQINYQMTFLPGINNKTQNIEDVRRLLVPIDNPKLYYFSSLSNFPSEMKQYRLRSKKTKPDTDDPAPTPLKKKDHTVNCIQYFASQILPEYSFQEHSANELLEAEAKKDDSEIEMPDDLFERRNKIQKIRIIRHRKSKIWSSERDW